jgi:hypothetical protein
MTKDVDESRRGFLKLAAVAAPAAVVGAPAVAGEAQPPPEQKGLRQTEHTQKYWTAARF